MDARGEALGSALRANAAGGTASAMNQNNTGTGVARGPASAAPGRPPTRRGTPPLPPPVTRTPAQTHNGPASSSGGTKPAIGGIVPEDIDAVYHQMQHLGNKWADAHAEAEMLEEAKKCVLATITLHYITDGNTKAAAEVQAFASQEYQDHVKRMVEARRRANLAKIELESIKTHLNLTRTYEATRREEMKLM